MNGERRGGGLHLLTLGLFSLCIFDPASWLFVSSLFYIGVFLALVLFGFCTALGAKPVMGKLRIAD